MFYLRQGFSNVKHKKVLKKRKSKTKKSLWTFEFVINIKKQK